MQLIGNWAYPNTIRFGAGRIAELGEVCQSVGLKRPLFVTDKGLADLPITQNALSLVEAAGLGRSVFSDVDPDPNEKNVRAGEQAYREGQHDGVIAFGGGSALDLGKLLPFLAAQDSSNLWGYAQLADTPNTPNDKNIGPIVAIPTTAGTGSEVGRASVISDSVAHQKRIFIHPSIVPSAVICDPELTLSMPRAIAIGTGLDTFSHLVEAYSSQIYHPMSQGIALEGMRLVAENLPNVIENENDIESRAHVMAAASMGAVAFSKGLGAVHALSHAIGASHHTHHGTTNAVLLPAVLQFNRPLIESVFERAARYLDIRGGFDGFCEFVIAQNSLLGVPATLSELGVRNANHDQLIKAALQDFTLYTNPRKMDAVSLRTILDAAM